MVPHDDSNNDELNALSKHINRSFSDVFQPQKKTALLSRECGLSFNLHLALSQSHRSAPRNGVGDNNFNANHVYMLAVKHKIHSSLS